jgi:hypothetical protein
LNPFGAETKCRENVQRTMDQRGKKTHDDQMIERSQNLAKVPKSLFLGYYNYSEGGGYNTM